MTGVEHDVQPVPTDEEEMISVAGDTVTNNHYAAPPKSPVSAVASPLMKYAAMSLAAVVLPLAGALLATWWNQPTPPVVVAPSTPSADTDTQYFFGIE